MDALDGYLYVSYLVAEAGWADDIQISTVEMSTDHNGTAGQQLSDWQQVDLQTEVQNHLDTMPNTGGDRTVPVVISQVQTRLLTGDATCNDCDTDSPLYEGRVTTRHRALSSSGFQMRLERPDRDTSHTPSQSETVGWLAMPAGRRDFGGLEFEAAHANVHPAAEYLYLEFASPMKNAVVFGGLYCDSCQEDALRLLRHLPLPSTVIAASSGAASGVQVTIMQDRCLATGSSEMHEGDVAPVSIISVAQNIETTCPSVSSPKLKRIPFHLLVLSFICCFAGMVLMIGPVEFTLAILMNPCFRSYRTFLNEERVYSLPLVRTIALCWAVIVAAYFTGSDATGKLGAGVTYLTYLTGILHTVFGANFFRNCFIIAITSDSAHTRSQDGRPVRRASPGTANDANSAPTTSRETTANPLVPESQAPDVEAPPAAAPTVPKPQVRKGPSLLRCGKCSEIFGLPPNTPPDAAARCPHCGTVNRQPPTFADKHNRLQRRLKHMRLTLQRQRRQRSATKLKIRVHRDRVLADTFQQLRHVEGHVLASLPLQVSFEGEVGVDIGGLTRDWMFLVMQELLDPQVALFRSCEGNYVYQINPHSSINPEHMDYFRLLGKLMAKCICDGMTTPFSHFTPDVYNSILQRPTLFSDLQVIDADVFRSLQWVLDNNVDELGLNFVVDVDEWGVIKQQELKEGGKDIVVTEENKHEFVELKAKYSMVECRTEQLLAVCHIA